MELLLDVYNPRLYLPLMGCIGMILILAVLGGRCLLAYGELLTTCIFQAVGSFPLVGLCCFTVAENMIFARYKRQGIEVEGEIVDRIEPKEQDLSFQSLIRDVLMNHDYRSSSSQIPKIYSIVVEYGVSENERYRKQLTIRNEPAFLVDKTISLVMLPSHPKTARYTTQIRNVSNMWLCMAIFISSWFAVMFWWYLPLEAMQITTALDLCNVAVEYSQNVFWCTYAVGGLASILTNLNISVKLLNQLMHLLLEGNCQELQQPTQTGLNAPTGDKKAELDKKNAVEKPKIYKDPSGLFGMLIV